MQSNRSRARTALANAQTAPAASDDVVIARRRAAAGKDQAELDPFGRRLLLDLDMGLSLARTAHLYPHIVNRLALLWNDAEQLEAYLDSVLITDRTTRMGLDFAALCELDQDPRCAPCLEAVPGTHRAEAVDERQAPALGHRRPPGGFGRGRPRPERCGGRSRRSATARC
jgi:hypothetical protein